jgi:hypothetical protein
VKDKILRALAYYDVFAYPLTATEIHQHLSIISTLPEVSMALEQLQHEGLIFKFEDLYTPRNNSALCPKRKTGNELAKDLLQKAYQKAGFIAKFPFIRGICISGSLSKNYADEKSDLDFFIITQPKRLWIARTIFDFYRKLFVRKKFYKHYCLNYFISFDQLTIQEQNIFTATELATLKPVWGIRHYENLMKSNDWVFSYFPNLILKKATESISFKKAPLLKRVIESIINFFLADFVDSVVMKIRFAWFKMKYQRNFSKADFEVAFKSKTHVSKVHTQNGQQKILALFEQNVKVLSTQLESLK